MTLHDLQVRYSSDPKGGQSRLVECFMDYRFTGEVHPVSRLGEADCIIKKGMALEVKCGHGWIIEPQFHTYDELMEYLDSRHNPMIKATHVAYLPYRAECGEDCNNCLFFPALQFLKILDSFGKLQIKENRGLWGIAMKPWIAEGYAQKSSAKKDAIIRETLNDKGLCIEEFAQKFGFQLFNL